MNDLNLQGFNSDEAFQELNAEELTSVDGGFFVHPMAGQPRRSIVLNPADRGITWGAPVEPICRLDGGIFYNPASRPSDGGGTGLIPDPHG